MLAGKDAATAAVLALALPHHDEVAGAIGGDRWLGLVARGVGVDPELRPERKLGPGARREARQDETKDPRSRAHFGTSAAGVRLCEGKPRIVGPPGRRCQRAGVLTTAWVAERVGFEPTIPVKV